MKTLQTSLLDLEVLLIDCQTTGSNPGEARVLEVGWCRWSASHSGLPAKNDMTAHLVSRDEPVDIPERIQSLTGIQPDDLADGTQPDRVRNELAAEISDGILPIAHYANFEKRFLTASSGFDLPEMNRILCTHRIARRRFPDLPRKGIRELAGYFGVPVDAGKKRVVPHLRATAVIWQNLVKALRDRPGVTTLPDLQAWRKNTDVGQPETYRYDISREERLSLPEKPGVYYMENAREEILYIGKATSLRDRVNSYFQSHRSLPGRTLSMLTRVKSIRHTITATPLEAALLENREIKKKSPPCNRALTDGSRSILFVDRQLQIFSRTPETNQAFGPLSRPERFRFLRFLLDYLQEGPFEMEFQNPRLNRLSGEDHFKEGLHTWRDHLNESPGTLSAPDLIRRGIYLQNIYQPPESSETKREDSKQEDRSEEEKVRSPDEIAKDLRSILRRAGREVLRGRWIRMFRHGVLYWQPDSHAGDAGRWRRCIFDRNSGSIPEADWVSHPKKTDFPAEEKPENEPFDALEYDQFRVLIGEVKKQLRDNRVVLVQVKPGKYRDHRDLERCLPDL